MNDDSINLLPQENYEDELKNYIENSVREDKVTFVVGLSGMGKSRILNEVAKSLHSQSEKVISIDHYNYVHPNHSVGEDVLQLVSLTFDEHNELIENYGGQLPGDVYTFKGSTLEDVKAFLGAKHQNLHHMMLGIGSIISKINKFEDGLTDDYITNYIEKTVSRHLAITASEVEIQNLERFIHLEYAADTSYLERVKERSLAIKYGITRFSSLEFDYLFDELQRIQPNDESMVYYHSRREKFKQVFNTLIENGSNSFDILINDVDENTIYRLIALLNVKEFFKDTLQHNNAANSTIAYHNRRKFSRSLRVNGKYLMPKKYSIFIDANSNYQNLTGSAYLANEVLQPRALAQYLIDNEATDELIHIHLHNHIGQSSTSAVNTLALVLQLSKYFSFQVFDQDRSQILKYSKLGKGNDLFELT